MEADITSKKNPLISVIVPVYKVEQYLHRCVDSILAQTYTNLEIILIDDGSPDRSGAICDEYAAKDSRIRVIHQKNAGLGAARNAGLDVCTGAYVCFVDSDDYIEHDMIRLLVVSIGDADLCGCGTIRETQDGVTLSETKVEAGCTLSGMTVLRQHYTGQNGKLGITEVAVWGKLYRRSLFKEIRFQPGLLFEDIHLMPFLMSQCAKTIFIPYIGYHYLVTPGSITNSSDSMHQKKCYEDSFRIWADHEALYTAKDCQELLSEVLCARMDKLISHMCNNSIPEACEVWSRNLLRKTAAQLMTKPIGNARKLRYIAFVLLGRHGYRMLKHIVK